MLKNLKIQVMLVASSDLLNSSNMLGAVPNFFSANRTISDMNFLGGIVFTCFVGYVCAVVPFFLPIYCGSTALVSGHHRSRVAHYFLLLRTYIHV